MFVLAEFAVGSSPQTPPSGAELGFGQRGSTSTRVRGEHTGSPTAWCERFCLSDLDASSPEKVFMSCALSCCTSELLLVSRVKLRHPSCHVQGLSLGWSVVTAARVCFRCGAGIIKCSIGLC